MTILDRKEREFKRREEDILAAALSLFDRDDWQSVTIDEIAAKAEIGKGTIYKHFESKDQIYAKLVLDFHRKVIAELRAIDRGQKPLQVIGECMDVFWRAHGQADASYKRLNQYCRRKDFRKLVGEKLGRELDALDEEVMNLLGPVFERGMREGELVQKPVESLMLGSHAAMVGLIEIQDMDCMKAKAGDMTPEQQYQEVREFTLRGISRR